MPWQDLMKTAKNVLSMTNKSLLEDIQSLSAFYEGGLTKNVSYRKFLLRGLKKQLQEHEEELLNSLYLDLNKSRQEALFSEILLVYSEIDLMLSKLDDWTREKKVMPSILQMPAKAYSIYEPLGRVLIFSPWNYPVLLSLQPLIGALAAGNVVAMKPSRSSPETAKSLKKILEGWNDRVVKVLLGGEEVQQGLMDEPWDLIFFTGSTRVGRMIAQKAGKTLSPSILELGGKSPALVMEAGDMDKVAQRILFGKYMNSGQTCIAPDYILVEKGKKKELVEALIRGYGDFNTDRVRCVNLKHYQRLHSYLKDQTLLFEGEKDEEKLLFGLHIVDEPSVSSPLMKEEIFGAILPVFEMEPEDMFLFIKKRPKPLALYCFTENNDFWKKVVKELSFGGGMKDGTLLHLAGSLPFGGVGESGWGAYHGKKSFTSFSHEKSILEKSRGYVNPFKKSRLLDWAMELLLKKVRH